MRERERGRETRRVDSTRERKERSEREMRGVEKEAVGRGGEERVVECFVLCCTEGDNRYYGFCRMR